MVAHLPGLPNVAGLAITGGGSYVLPFGFPGSLAGGLPSLGSNPVS